MPLPKLTCLILLFLYLGLSRVHAQCYVGNITGPWQICEGTTATYYVPTPQCGQNYSWQVTGGVITGYPFTGAVSIHWTSQGFNQIDLYYDDTLSPPNGYSQQTQVYVLGPPFPINRTVLGPDTLQVGEYGNYYSCCTNGLGPTLAYNSHISSISGSGSFIDLGGIAGPIPPGPGLCEYVNWVKVKWCTPGWQTMVIHVSVYPGGSCFDTLMRSVYVEPAPPPTYTHEFFSCDSFEITTTGYASYNWSDGGTDTVLTVSQSGTYWLETTDTSGCLAVDTFEVVISPADTVQISPPGPFTICGADTLQLSGQTGYASYLWSNGDTMPQSSFFSAGNVSLHVTDSNGCMAADTVTLQSSSAWSLNISPFGPQDICPGDSIQLSGTPGFAHYHWNVGDTVPMITADLPGTYTLTVTDSNGCTASDSVTVSILPLPQVQISGPPIACTGDSIQLTGTPGLAHYEWGPGDTMPSVFVHLPGTYALTVTDSNGCRNADSATVSFHPLPQVQINPPGPLTLCWGDSLQLTGAPGLQQYQWSTGDTTPHLTTSISGTYSLTGTDSNGCRNSDSVTVLFAPLPQVQVNPSGPISICEGDSVQLSATPAMVSYLWSSGDTSATIWVGDSGIYSCFATDLNNCTGQSNPVVVEVHPNPLAIAFAVGDTLFASPNIPGYQYQWLLGGLPVPGANTPVLYPSQSGSYAIVVTDTNGCQSQSDTVHYSIPLAVEPGRQDFWTLIYPNPSQNGTFFVEWSQGYGDELLAVEVYDALGRSVGGSVPFVVLAGGKARFQLPVAGVYQGVFRFDSGRASTVVMISH